MNRNLIQIGSDLFVAETIDVQTNMQVYGSSSIDIQVSFDVSRYPKYHAIIHGLFVNQNMGTFTSNLKIEVTTKDFVSHGSRIKNIEIANNTLKIMILSDYLDIPEGNKQEWIQKKRDKLLNELLG